MPSLTEKLRGDISKKAGSLVDRIGQIQDKSSDFVKMLLKDGAEAGEEAAAAPAPGTEVPAAEEPVEEPEAPTVEEPAPTIEKEMGEVVKLKDGRTVVVNSRYEDGAITGLLQEDYNSLKEKLSKGKKSAEQITGELAMDARSFPITEEDLVEDIKKEDEEPAE